MNGERKDLVSLGELLRQEELKSLSPNSQRWVRILVMHPDNQIIMNALQEMFFANQDRKKVFLDIIKFYIDSSVEDRTVIFITQNFSTEEQEFIRANPNKFSRELGNICLYKAEGKDNLALKHLENLKGSLPLPEGAPAREFEITPRLKKVFDQARLIAQQVGGLQLTQIMHRDDFLEFKRAYNKLKETEKSVIKDGMVRRGKDRRDQFRSGAGKIGRLL